MKRIIVYIIMYCLLEGCTNVHTEIDYRVKKVDSDDYYYKYIYGTSYIRSKKSDIYISLKFEEDTKLIKVDFSILSNLANSYLNTRILNNIIIYSGSGETIVINKEDIIYKIEKAKYDSNRKNLDIFIKLPKELKGKIKINFGRVKIGNKIVDIPEIELQKYKVSESYTLLEALLNEGGENIKFYKKEGWIDN